MPNWLPCDTTAPAVPPMIAPRICPATAPIWYFCGLARLRGAVAQRDVGHLVRHDADHLTLGFRGLDHPAVHVHRTARQREGIDLLQVDDLEAVLKLRMAQLGRDGVHEPVT